MKRYRTALFSVALSASVAPLIAQLPPFTQTMTDAQKEARGGRYLAASDMLAPEALTSDGKQKNRLVFQLWSQVTALMTDELDPAAFVGDAADPSWDTRFANARPRDAIEEITARARQTRIVILNEAHHSPRDRAFALQVARALRPLGYSFLAAETFANDGTGDGDSTAVRALRADGFVRRGTGFYTLNPVYAGFVREALKLGYTPIAYEQHKAQTKVPGSIAERDEDQAENLMAAIFRKNPAAKIMIYVGHGHVTERRDSPDTAAMVAEQIKRLSGIDPLTIDQVNMSDLAPRARTAYPIAAARITRASIFFEGTQPMDFASDRHLVDVQVVHPRRRYLDGRPIWLQALGGRPMSIPRNLLPTSGRRLIQAFAADAPEDAVPLDQVLVTAGRSPPKLMLPTERVRFGTQQGS